jgi:hypothetical protein
MKMSLSEFTSQTPADKDRFHNVERLYNGLKVFSIARTDVGLLGLGLTATRVATHIVAHLGNYRRT